MYFKPEGYRSQKTSGTVMRVNIEVANKIYSDNTIWNNNQTWGTYEKAIAGLTLNINQTGFK